MAATEEIMRALKGYSVVVTKSTVPVGTKRMVVEAVWATVDVTSNPEFLRKRAAIDEFMGPDWMLVGVKSDRAAAANVRI